MLWLWAQLLSFAARLLGLPLRHSLSDARRSYRERCFSEHCVSDLFSDLFLFPSCCSCMLSADACHVFAIMQQGKIMRSSSISRVPPSSLGGKKMYFLLSLLVSERENWKRLDCISHFAAGCRKPFSWYSVAFDFPAMLLLQKLIGKGARLRSGKFWFKTGQDTTLHQ